ncbi:hypothetical protein ACO2Q3_12690 [Caulobacter sp. KR2-114]|uniref:hypothetical protein n=1 Tax=Caulobacter sp. KR2-114 TaxID=3400912 RepID=UPI003BFEFD23
MSAWVSCAQAQSCPADLSNLLDQVQTPELRDLASTPLDTIISRSGGIDQAISLTQTAVDHLTTLHANPGNATDPTTLAYINEAYLVETAELHALQCRKNGG